ncbi:MAG: ABC transporter ATP-binding protein [Ardenticatenaceae bacterium]|nr:ABC transporter ATP-binding protein [Ardenticatenaceae bacterium]MCB8990995.1 ABC transporter ATP-binding protein [Ardenticatenaceae bacterium]MCB9005325.1 ABC transporter ATP-binding protein [Ardenticatenaceae bacterium]
MTEVTLTHLSKSYDGRYRAVSDLSLTAPCGKITALLGPSGCGKTTVLRMIAGLLAPGDGEIAFDGHSILPIPAEKRGAVMAFQNHMLFPTMNVADNVGFGLKMRGVDKNTIRQRVAAMLELVKLPGFEKRRPNELSGGQQQRVALARALVVEPKVLLLDEPLSNLDAHLRNEMRDLIFSIQRQLGITTIFVTHDQEEAVILADQIALIFGGELQQVGPPEDFYERPLSIPIARFFGGVNFIPGHKWGAQVETAVGAFIPSCRSSQPDGPVMLTIRPENIRLCANGEEDRVNGRVLSHIYAGTHTRFKIATSDPDQSPLEVIADASLQHRICDGSPISLHLPPDKIWLMPR